jgi:tRNA A37 threonylcarbamoyltransferase TsaD
VTTVLGIETSCDETAAAVVRDGRDVLSSVVSSQIDLHARYGGVVPELAGRAHVELIPPGVAPERVAMLRKAFMAAMTDPALIADAKRTDLDLEAMSGSDLQDLIASLQALPSGIVERAKQSLIDKPAN